MHSYLLLAVLITAIAILFLRRDGFTDLPYGDIHSTFLLQPYLISTPTPSTTPNAVHQVSDFASGWNKAYATHYSSYPTCCPEAPNYSPNAPKGECDDYSGCKYMGKFAGVKGKLSYPEVQKRNIVAFFKKGDKQAWKNIKGKKIRVRNPQNGQTLEVEALDTCGDKDCKGCCSKNASKGGGTLIDFETHTAQRFWGGKPRNGVIEWQYV